MIFKKLTALVFIVFFLTIISAPTIVSSIDKSVDISMFYGLGEEEESENFKILFEQTTIGLEEMGQLILNTINVEFTNGLYSNPLLNIILPPPEMVV